MKKKLILVIAMLTVAVVLLAACTSSGELKGTYSAANASLFSGLQFDTITFSSNNRMSMSSLGILGTSGTYRLDGDKIEFSYKEPSLFGEGKAVVKSMTFERSGKSIFIDGYEFVKDK